MGLSLEEMNYLTVAEMYDLFDIYAQDSDDEDVIIEPDQSYYDKLFGRDKR